MEETVKELRDKFIAEAKNSPTLISDLAQMEKYISESYDGRALIELLQNADDAFSSEFYIKKINENTFLIANNGRKFNKEDLFALCRSGSSTKKRKDNSIGFRGIGFKSVVNFSKVVHLISGDLKITFSKEITRRLVGNDINVPLIRIPHQYVSLEYEKIIRKTVNMGYTTIFIFETDKSSLKSEMESFDITSMLFLKNINKIIFDFDNYRIMDIDRNKLDDISNIVNIHTEDRIQKWIVFSESKVESIAFKINNDKAVDANSDENFIHSFMPTRERFAIPCKINGDFSTDPSRTKIIIDNETDNSIKIVSKLFSKIMIDILNKEIDYYEILPIISNMKVNPISNITGKTVNDYFFDRLRVDFLSRIHKIAKCNNIVLQPSWMADEDLEKLENNDCFIIKRKLLDKLKGLERILELFNIKEIDIDELLLKSTEKVFTYQTRINILERIINKYQFNMRFEEKEIIKKALLFTGKKDIISISSIKSSNDIETNFLMELCEKLDNEKKLEYFLLKFNIKTHKSTEIWNKLNSNINSANDFRGNKIIPKWRSVEKNTAIILEGYGDIVHIEDVSARNLGYDLEATCKNGSKKFFEVKSVSNFGEVFSMTNNEYLTALQYSNQYNLIVVKQTDNKIMACIIKDPVHTLNLEKRIRSWEWICDEYNGEILEEKLY